MGTLNLSFGELNYLVNYHAKLVTEQTYSPSEGETSFSFHVENGIIHLPIHGVTGYSRAVIYEVASHINQLEKLYLGDGRTIYCHIQRLQGESHVS